MTSLVSFDDAALCLCCLASIAFGGCVHGRIEGAEARKWSATLMGLLVMCSMLGLAYAWHAIAMTLLVAALVKRIRSDKCFVVVFAIMIIYLTICRIPVPDITKFKNCDLVLMTLTLKLTGVAFEMYQNREVFITEDCPAIDPTYEEIVHYCFCYIGILNGPYVRYRTYDDFIKKSYYKYGTDKGFKEKLLMVPVYSTLYVVFERLWPLDYAISDEFAHHNMLYKLTYAPIALQSFRFWMYSGLLMSECMCSAAGFGAYPVELESTSTHGPTKNYSKLAEMSEDKLREATYDFNTNSIIDIYTIQTCPWVTKYTMAWNKSVQYFMGVYVYKSIPKYSYLKQFRPFITFMVCALWHGVHMGFLISMLVFPLYMPTDKLYIKIHSNLRGWKSYTLALVMYVIQFYIVSFGIIAFRLLHREHVLKYYNSVYWLPYCSIGVVHIVGLFLLYLVEKKKIE